MSGDSSVTAVPGKIRGPAKKKKTIKDSTGLFVMVMIKSIKIIFVFFSGP